MGLPGITLPLFTLRWSIWMDLIEQPNSVFLLQNCRNESPQFPSWFTTVSRIGLEGDLISYNTLVSSSERATNWPLALWLWQWMDKSTLTTSNAVASACAKGFCWQNALYLMYQLKEPDVITYNVTVFGQPLFHFVPLIEFSVRLLVWTRVINKKSISSTRLAHLGSCKVWSLAGAQRAQRLQGLESQSSLTLWVLALDLLRRAILTNNADVKTCEAAVSSCEAAQRYGEVQQLLGLTQCGSQ